MPNLLALFRALRVLLHVGTGLLLCVVIALDRGRHLPPERATQWWSRHLLRILNLRCERRGAPLSGARMSVANHVSWLDIPLIAAAEPTRFVAKSDIRHWPIAGWLADAGGTFYIRRGKGGSRPLLDRLTPHLAAGGSIVIFPEGTTTDGSSVLTFHARLFAAAVDARCPVQPVAIRYGRAQDGRDIAPFIGDDDLVSHIWRLLQEPGLVAQITYGEPLRGSERDALALASRAAVCAALAIPAATTPAEAPELRALAV